MRDLFLVAVTILGLLVTLRYPFAGVLLWSWFTCMDPHEEAFGFARTAPLNLIIASVTIVAWLFSPRERKTPPVDATLILVFLFLAWITINTFEAAFPIYAWHSWDLTWKTIALGLLIGATATNKYRIHALIWTVVLSIAYYSIKGGIFTVVTGGHSHVLGPPNSQIADNNTLALATLMTLPLMNYLRLQSKNVWVRRGMVAATAISVVSILGSYSRGGFVALAALGMAWWFRSKKKLLYPIAAAIVIIPAIFLMPQEYFDRLGTIGESDTDNSFQGRMLAWQVAWDYARDHFPFGAGFAGTQEPPIFNYYIPGVKSHAAHSIFFEVLGDNGFPGFVIYVSILILAFVNCARVRRRTRGDPELAWAYDLAGMIQLTLFVFCVGGAALSMAYYDIFFICVGLLPALRELVGAKSPKLSGFVRAPATIGAVGSGKMAGSSGG